MYMNNTHTPQKKTDWKLLSPAEYCYERRGQTQSPDTSSLESCYPKNGCMCVTSKSVRNLWISGPTQTCLFESATSKKFQEVTPSDFGKLSSR